MARVMLWNNIDKLNTVVLIPMSTEDILHSRQNTDLKVITTTSTTSTTTTTTTTTSTTTTATTTKTKTTVKRKNK